MESDKATLSLQQNPPVLVIAHIGISGGIFDHEVSREYICAKARLCYNFVLTSSGLQPATRKVAGFRFTILRAAQHPRIVLPPPRRAGLRFPPSVGHGRGLATRPGCAGPGEGVGSPCLRLTSLGALRSKLAPCNLRLRPASPTPGERFIP